MKSFFKWIEVNKLELPEIPPSETPTVEGSSGKRAAVRSHAYPELYGRGQYPKVYFNPIAADNLVYNKDKE